MAAALLAACVVFHGLNALIDARRSTVPAVRTGALSPWPSVIATALFAVVFLATVPAARSVEAIPALLGIGLSVVASRWLIYPAALNALRGLPPSYVTEVRVAHGAPSEKLLIDFGLVHRDYVPFEGERRTRHVYLLKTSGWLFKLALLAAGLAGVAWSSQLM
ncbi:MAG: hypothetical protein AAF624_01615 [Bacteroidota bacterium]